MFNFLLIVVVKVLKVLVIVFIFLQQFLVVLVVLLDVIIIGFCVYVVYNVVGFGGFYDVGIYVSNFIVLLKLMIDFLERRRDSRKRYREKMVLMKINQFVRKKGKKLKILSLQNDNQKENEILVDLNDFVVL